MSRAAWTTTELQILRDFYPANGARAIANATRRPLAAIRKKAQELGVRRQGATCGRKVGSTMRYWTEAEVQLMNKRYPELGAKHLADMLKRPLVSVYSKAFHLGLAASKKPHPIGAEISQSVGRDRRVKKIRVANTGIRRQDWKRVEVVEWERLHGPVPEGFALAVVPGMVRVAANCRLIKISEVPLLATFAKASPEERELIVLKNRFCQRLAFIEKRLGVQKPRHRQAWTAEETQILQAACLTQSVEEIGIRLCRSAKAVQRKLESLRACGEPDRRWTVAETEILKALYPTRTALEIAQQIGRSLNAVSRRAERLGLKKRGAVCR